MPKVDYKTLDPTTTVVVATGNAHKVTEIEAILKPVMPGTTFYALGELGDFPDPVENGDTFTENAIIKAQAALDETGLTSVADDSGLVVDALGGEPGIMSARWAGVHGDDARNNAKMMREMADVPEDKRGAHFHSSVVLLRPDGTILTGEGDCHGKIGHEPEGTHCVDLTESTIEANSRLFEKEEDVPRQAYTMGVQTIMNARMVLMVANGKNKAQAVHDMCFGPVAPSCPASILQLHANCVVVADDEALSLCEGLY